MIGLCVISSCLTAILGMSLIFISSETINFEEANVLFRQGAMLILLSFGFLFCAAFSTNS